MDAFPALDLDKLHLRSHAEGVCRDYRPCLEINEIAFHLSNRGDVWRELYAYSLDILCLMALTEALGLEYGVFVN